MGLRVRRLAAVEDMKENADARLSAIKKELSSMLQQLDRQMEKNVCVQMENTSKAIKSVNHAFHVIKTYSHIPGIFLMILVYILLAILQECIMHGKSTSDILLFTIYTRPLPVRAL
jgi:hypothetical protein